MQKDLKLLLLWKMTKKIFLLYSEYSEKCNYIIQELQSYNVNFIHPICIDSMVARSIIENSSKLTVSKVPCICITENSFVQELIQGVFAFKYIDNILTSLRGNDEPEIPEDKPIVEEKKVVVPPPVKPIKEEIAAAPEKETPIMAVVEEDRDLEIRENPSVVKGIVSNDTVDILSIAQSMQKSREMDDNNKAFKAD